MDNKSKKSAPRKSRPRPNYKSKESREVKEPKSEIHNDPNWYTVNGQLLKDVSSFNFNHALGAPFTLQITEGAGTAYRNTIPGVMSIYTMPTIGTSVSANDPVNIAAKDIYSYVRHANSGHSNYDPADMMIYLLAMDSIYTYWSWMVRVLGTANIFSQNNRYIGDHLLTAQGVNPDSIRSNLADFRAYINTFALLASGKCVPKTMTYFVRHSWMYSNIYRDENVGKSQMYLYNPAFLYKYDINQDTGAGKLAAVPVTCSPSSLRINPRSVADNNALTLDDIMVIGKTLINAMSGQEDVGIISGDILKAYGAENLWKLMPIPENYGVLPVFSEEVLMQIHNTEFTSDTPIVWNTTSNAWEYNLSCLDIEQDTSVGSGILLFQPNFRGAAHLWYDKMLDFWKEEVTPEMSMVATRNKISAVGSVQGQTINGDVMIRACGSELPFFAAIWKTDPSSSSLIYSKTYYKDTAEAVGDSFFNEHPIQYVLNTTRTAITKISGEIDNYAILDQNNIEQLHTTALLSMFGVPCIK